MNKAIYINKNELKQILEIYKEYNSLGLINESNFLSKIKDKSSGLYKKFVKIKKILKDKFSLFFDFVSNNFLLIAGITIVGSVITVNLNTNSTSLYDFNRSSILEELIGDITESEIILVNNKGEQIYIPGKLSGTTSNDIKVKEIDVNKVSNKIISQGVFTVNDIENSYEEINEIINSLTKKILDLKSIKDNITEEITVGNKKLLIIAYKDNIDDSILENWYNSSIRILENENQKKLFNEFYFAYRGCVEEVIAANNTNGFVCGAPHEIDMMLNKYNIPYLVHVKVSDKTTLAQLNTYLGHEMGHALEHTDKIKNEFINAVMISLNESYTYNSKDKNINLKTTGYTKKEILDSFNFKKLNQIILEKRKKKGKDYTEKDILDSIEPENNSTEKDLNSYEWLDKKIRDHIGEENINYFVIKAIEILIGNGECIFKDGKYYFLSSDKSNEYYTRREEKKEFIKTYQKFIKRILKENEKTVKYSKAVKDIILKYKKKGLDINVEKAIAIILDGILNISYRENKNDGLGFSFDFVKNLNNYLGIKLSKEHLNLDIDDLHRIYKILIAVSDSEVVKLDNGEILNIGKYHADTVLDILRSINRIESSYLSSINESKNINNVDLIAERVYIRLLSENTKNKRKYAGSHPDESYVYGWPEFGEEWFNADGKTTWKEDREWTKQYFESMGILK
tara:strand:- start:1880 stop:3928 length:2049 start_codon:yes stop_codon:yes gene_type:complete